MTNNQDKINLLLEKLELLTKRQDDFSREINGLKQGIYRLKSSEENEIFEEEVEAENEPITESDFINKKEENSVEIPVAQKQTHQEQAQFSEPNDEKPSEVKRSLEKLKKLNKNRCFNL